MSAIPTLSPSLPLGTVVAMEVKLGFLESLSHPGTWTPCHLKPWLYRNPRPWWAGGSTRHPPCPLDTGAPGLNLRVVGQEAEVWEGAPPSPPRSEAGGGASGRAVRSPPEESHCVFLSYSLSYTVVCLCGVDTSPLQSLNSSSDSNHSHYLSVKNPGRLLPPFRNERGTCAQRREDRLARTGPVPRSKYKLQKFFPGPDFRERLPGLFISSRQIFQSPR